MRHTGGPKGKERSEELNKLASGAHELVYRTTSRTWEGPFIFIRISGEAVVVQLKHGRPIFRSNCIKPVTKAEWEESDEKTHDNEGQTESDI